MNDPTLLRPLADLDPSTASAIRLVATDVDGTLTRDGALDPAVVAVIAELTQAGIEVWPVSGRPAGEVLGLVRYLPGVARGIAENGLLEIVADRAPRWLGEPTDVARLRAIGEMLNAEHDAKLALAGDAFCRVGDVAYEREGRDLPELQRLQALVEAEGAHLVWSSVHVHIAERVPDKGEGLLLVTAEQGFSPQTVATIGDAPNDAGLFVGGRFGVTVGTADVAAIAHEFSATPQWLTQGRESEAFLELARTLLRTR